MTATIATTTRATALTFVIVAVFHGNVKAIETSKNGLRQPCNILN